MSLSGRIFAAAYEPMLRGTEEAGLADLRARTVASAAGRTLEIGAGTGLTLAHYPPAVTELILCEPEEAMADRLRPRAAERGAQVLVAPAEHLPLDDDSVDTVVSTLVLCTVDDPQAAIAEIDRVLRPGGRLLFLEHVRAADQAHARRQDRWDPLWKRVAGGCRCNRDTIATLRGSALADVHADTTRMPKAPAIVRPVVLGSAGRPAG